MRSVPFRVEPSVDVRPHLNLDIPDALDPGGLFREQRTMVPLAAEWFSARMMR